MNVIVDNLVKQQRSIVALHNKVVALESETRGSAGKSQTGTADDVLSYILRVEEDVNKTLSREIKKVNEKVSDNVSRSIDDKLESFMKTSAASKMIKDMFPSPVSTIKEFLTSPDGTKMVSEIVPKPKVETGSFITLVDAKKLVSEAIANAPQKKLDSSSIQDIAKLVISSMPTPAPSSDVSASALPPAQPVNAIELVEAMKDPLVSEAISDIIKNNMPAPVPTPSQAPTPVPVPAQAPEIDETKVVDIIKKFMESPGGTELLRGIVNADAAGTESVADSDITGDPEKKSKRKSKSKKNSDRNVFVID
jgi:hypothetical protein